jgi:membrane-associated phospholipid phosphatase
MNIKKTVTKIWSTLHERDVLVRLDIFLIMYFGWIGFTFFYNLIQDYSKDFVPFLLKLPFTSKQFIIFLMESTKDIPLLQPLLTIVYHFGFSGSIALTIFFILVYWKDFESADRLAFSYLLSYTLCGVIYSLGHVHAPHDVYGLKVFSVGSLTQEEFVLPSLHNTIATVNIVTLWIHREKRWAKILISLNFLVPPATILLGHHWIYDALTGVLLAVIISKIAARFKVQLPKTIMHAKVSHIQRATIIGFLTGMFLLLFAISG